MCVCTYVRMYVRMYLCMYVCMYERVYVCMYVRTYVCMYVCNYVCIYVYMYVRMYVRTYVCMYVFTYLKIIYPASPWPSSYSSRLIYNSLLLSDPFCYRDVTSLPIYITISAITYSAIGCAVCHRLLSTGEWSRRIVTVDRASFLKR